MLKAEIERASKTFNLKMKGSVGEVVTDITYVINDIYGKILSENIQYAEIFKKELLFSINNMFEKYMEINFKDLNQKRECETKKVIHNMPDFLENILKTIGAENIEKIEIINLEKEKK